MHAVGRMSELYVGQPASLHQNRMPVNGIIYVHQARFVHIVRTVSPKDKGHQIGSIQIRRPDFRPRSRIGETPEPFRLDDGYLVRDFESVQIDADLRRPLSVTLICG